MWCSTALGWIKPAVAADPKGLFFVSTFCPWAKPWFHYRNDTEKIVDLARVGPVWGADQITLFPFLTDQFSSACFRCGDVAELSASPKPHHATTVQRIPWWVASPIHGRPVCRDTTRGASAYWLTRPGSIALLAHSRGWNMYWDVEWLDGLAWDLQSFLI